MIPTSAEHLQAWVHDRGTQAILWENHFGQLQVTFEDKRGLQVKVLFDAASPSKWEIIIQSKVNQLQLFKPKSVA